MDETRWHDTLQAPRSLLTGSDISVSVVEDPGFIVIEGLFQQDEALKPACERYGIPLNLEVQHVVFFAHGCAVRRKRNEFWIFCDRALATDITRTLNDSRSDVSLIVYERTGHFSALRLAGSAATELLTKVCPAPVNTKVAAQFLSFTFLAEETLVIAERSGNTLGWQMLTPRSETQAIAEALASSAILMPRIGL